MTSFPAAPDVYLAIARKLRRSRTGPEGSPLLTVYPEMTAEAVMGVVGPVLEARDAEIARLRAEIGVGSERRLRSVANLVAATDRELSDALLFFRHEHPGRYQRLRALVLGEGKSGSEEEERDG